VEVTHSGRIKPEKLIRLQENSGRIGAVRKVLIHGGAVEEVSGRGGDHVVQLPLSRFLLKPEAILQAKEEG
jgi:hypothetical protein